MRSHWATLAFRRDVVRRGIRVGIVVGTILVAINHGGSLLAGKITSGTIFQMFLTYLVPYSVSTYASVRSIQEADHDSHEDDV